MSKRCHYQLEEAVPLRVRATGSQPFVYTQNSLCLYAKAFVPLRKIASPLHKKQRLE